MLPLATIKLKYFEDFLSKHVEFLNLFALTYLQFEIVQKRNIITDQVKIQLQKYVSSSCVMKILKAIKQKQ